MRKKKVHKRFHQRSKSLVNRDVELLREWASNRTLLQLYVPVGATSLIHAGRVVEIQIGGLMVDFRFITDSGMFVPLTPAMWSKSTIEENIGTLGRSIYIYQPDRTTQSLTIRELRNSQDGTSNREKAREQLKNWEKMHAELGVTLDCNQHALFFLGSVKEMPNGVFSFVQSAKLIQVLIELEEFTYVKIIREDDGKVSMGLASSADRLYISDAILPDISWLRFKPVSSSVQ